MGTTQTGLADGENLFRFCEAMHPRGRSDLQQPFTHKEWTAATNGHIFVVVQARDGITREAPAYQAVLFRLAALVAESNNWAPFPLVPWPALKRCSPCQGMGMATYSACPECGGDGEVFFENHFNEYYVECRTCHGECYEEAAGGDQHCANCLGSGSVPENRLDAVDILGVRVQARYAKLIEQPGVEVSVIDLENDGNRMLGFRQVIDGEVLASGGIMGMRK